MTTQHTPGPWHRNETYGLIMHGKTEIAALHSGNEANARLVVASPDLLAALKVFVDSAPGRPSLMDYYHDGSQCEAPESCAHCQAMKQGRAARDRAEHPGD